MKREIKFRGKRVDNGDWVYGTPVTYRDGHTAIYDGLLMLYGAEATTLSRNKVDPDTVGQFTGLKDSKGVDIYEGDLLPFNNIKNNQVCFVDGQFIACGGCGYVTVKCHKPLEVIGNIYENPELLEET